MFFKKEEKQEIKDLNMMIRNLQHDIDNLRKNIKSKDEKIKELKNKAVKDIRNNKKIDELYKEINIAIKLGRSIEDININDDKLLRIKIINKYLDNSSLTGYSVYYFNIILSYRDCSDDLIKELMDYMSINNYEIIDL